MTRILQSLAAAAAVLSIFISSVASQTATTASVGSLTTGDCYSSIPSDFESKGPWTFQSSGYCQGQCASSPYFAITEGSICYCGNELPPASAKAPSSSCNTPCQGYSPQTCGGTNFYQLYQNGGTSGSAGSSSSQSSAKPQTTASSAVPSVVTQSGRVVTVTAATSPGSGSNGGGGSSKVGIAVGVVVGLLAIASIIGGLVLFMKRRRRLAIEEDHRRNATVSSFVAGGKSETSSATDSRLDPAFSHHRRNSLGSIADEQDFSRRILQVRNPDRESKASNMA